MPAPGTSHYGVRAPLLKFILHVLALLAVRAPPAHRRRALILKLVLDMLALLAVRAPLAHRQ
eukprot:CAMPEP_0119496968 /NCGR_PEP_ID=MMETSP1344-20130328/20153_1 /TAXON_ID=236787 /ORGANISM="Florenciella parvula, Strain CCMP2471" /LENGTH=61 /DNA_ID=CAMNT_0007532713 /DNA_START=1 /DNA_END=183 /DNA_ORIENTATION=-